MKFTEEKLEQAVIDLFKAESYRHLTGEQIHKELPECLLRDDLKQYLLNRYSAEKITLNDGPWDFQQLFAICTRSATISRRFVSIFPAVVFCDPMPWPFWAWHSGQCEDFSPPVRR